MHACHTAVLCNKNDFFKPINIQIIVHVLGLNIIKQHKITNNFKVKGKLVRNGVFKSSQDF